MELVEHRRVLLTFFTKMLPWKARGHQSFEKIFLSISKMIYRKILKFVIMSDKLDRVLHNAVKKISGQVLYLKIDK